MTDVEKKRALTEFEKAEIEEELQRALEEDPEAFEEVFGSKQPFDSNTRPWEIFEFKSGGWGVVLPGRGSGGGITAVGPFATREGALAFIAAHAPRND